MVFFGQVKMFYLLLFAHNEQFDEKNIRRRVYDAFNVLIAIDVIAKDKKEIRWRGFPITKTEQAKGLEANFNFPLEVLGYLIIRMFHMVF